MAISMRSASRGSTARRISGSTGRRKKSPRVRFERDERSALQALATHPYRSLVLSPERDDRTTLYRPVAGVADVAVERRTLTTYAAIEEVA